MYFVKAPDLRSHLIYPWGINSPYPPDLHRGGVGRAGSKGGNYVIMPGKALDLSYHMGDSVGIQYSPCNSQILPVYFTNVSEPNPY